MLKVKEYKIGYLRTKGKKYVERTLKHYMGDRVLLKNERFFIAKKKSKPTYCTTDLELLLLQETRDCWDHIPINLFYGGDNEGLTIERSRESLQACRLVWDGHTLQTEYVGFGYTGLLEILKEDEKEIVGVIKFI